MDFYVYTLADPRDGAVFYVGKGQRNRAWQHTEHVRRGRKVSNAAKTDRIKEILRSRREPTVEIVKRFTLEVDALRLEAEMIASLPNLTNVHSRGGATTRLVCGIPLQKRVKQHESMKDWLTKAQSWPNGATIPGYANGDAMAADFMEIISGLVAIGEDIFYGPRGEILKSRGA